MFLINGTPVLNTGIEKDQVGYFFDSKIVWIENGQGATITGIPVISFDLYVEAAKTANILPISAGKLAEYIAQAESAQNDLRAKYIAKAREENKNRELERDIFKTLISGYLPSDAKAVIIAEFERDKSDTMSDYWGSKTEKVLILSWSKHTRDLFPELRKAAKNAQETSELFDAPQSAEHREKYSMGGGYYLKNGSRYSTGWQVRKVPLLYGKNDKPENRLDRIPVGEIRLPKKGATKKEAPQKADNVEQSDNSKGFILKEGTKPGFIEIHFDEKPNEETRQELKDSGFRWSRYNSCWYGKNDNLPETYND